MEKESMIDAIAREKTPAGWKYILLDWKRTRTMSFEACLQEEDGQVSGLATASRTTATAAGTTPCTAQPLQVHPQETSRQGHR